MGLEFMPDVPFREVFIHGLVLDAQGRKMSKSLGNVIDPIEVIEQYGADTLRFMLITGNTPGNDLRFQTERLEATRNFANKIWNASRFVLMNLTDYEETPEDAAESSGGKAAYTLADRWIRSRFNRTVEEVTRHLERYDLGEAARVIYEFIWNEFCDWYIEIVKPRLYGKENPESRKTAQKVLADTLRGTMELLHPFMPFITEEIWQHLPHQGKTVMLAPWPKADAAEMDEAAEAEMAVIMEAIKALRNLRSEMNVAPGKKAEAILMAQNEAALTPLRMGKLYYEPGGALAGHDPAQRAGKTGSGGNGSGERRRSLSLAQRPGGHREGTGPAGKGKREFGKGNRPFRRQTAEPKLPGQSPGRSGGQGKGKVGGLSKQMGSDPGKNLFPGELKRKRAQV